MDLDFTLILQISIVALVLVTFERVLFNPILDLLVLRENNIAGAKAESVKLLGETKAKEQELQNQLDSARRGALAERQRMLTEAREMERTLLDKARADALKKVEHARSALQASETQVRAQLQQSGKEIARVIASKVLSREVA